MILIKVNDYYYFLRPLSIIYIFNHIACLMRWFLTSFGNEVNRSVGRIVVYTFRNGLATDVL